VIQGLVPGEMVRIGGVVLALMRRGLVQTRIQFSNTVPGLPVLVPVELTEQGRLALQEKP
jgi:hypothetical protein